MAKWREGYTSDEDAVIIAYCNEAKLEGVPLATAYVRISEKISRPVSSVGNRYRRLISDTTIMNSKKKPLSEGERLILKLRALNRQSGRNAEKSVMYKEKYGELEREYEALKKSYQTLHVEHQSLIKTVKEALGESDDEESLAESIEDIETN